MQCSTVRLQCMDGAMIKTSAALAAFTFYLVLYNPAFSQRLVDPSTVAPEHREAAEKRRAEQMRQRQCAMKADSERILPRDRTAFLNQCLDELAAKQ